MRQPARGAAARSRTPPARKEYSALPRWQSNACHSHRKRARRPAPPRQSCRPENKIRRCRYRPKSRASRMRPRNSSEKYFPASAGRPRPAKRPPGNRPAPWSSAGAAGGRDPAHTKRLPRLQWPARGLTVQSWSPPVPFPFWLRHSPSSQQRQDAGLHRTGDTRLAAVNIHINFAAHAEPRKINARLDGKAGLRQDAARVARFEAVHIGPGAVHFLSDAVAGAMHKIFSISGLANDAARYTVHLPSLNGAPSGQRLLHKFDRAV